MRKMNYEQFQARVHEVAKARKIFIKPGLTNNITHAFELYQEVLASERMEVIISTVIGGNRPLTPLDNFKRPKCPECGAGFRLAPVNTGPRDQVGGDYHSQWYCTKCNNSVFNKETVQEILEQLAKVKS